MREENNAEFSVCEWFGLKPSRIIRGTVLVVRRKYSLKLFCNTIACPCHRFHLNKFYSNKKVSKHRLSRETVELN